MELAILSRLLERFVGLVTALGAENTQLFLSDLPEELRRRWLTALWAGYDFAHDVCFAWAGVSWGSLMVSPSNETLDQRPPAMASVALLSTLIF